MQNALLNLVAGKLSESPQVIPEKPASVTHFLLVMVDSSELQERRFCQPLLPFARCRFLAIPVWPFSGSPIFKAPLLSLKDIWPSLLPASVLGQRRVTQGPQEGSGLFPKGSDFGPFPIA